MTDFRGRENPDYPSSPDQAGQSPGFLFIYFAPFGLDQKPLRFLAFPRRLLPDWLRGQVRRALPLTSPLPIGWDRSSRVKGALRLHPHPFGARAAPSAPRAASGAALDPSSTHSGFFALGVFSALASPSLSGTWRIARARNWSAAWVCKASTWPRSLAASSRAALASLRALSRSAWA